MSRYYTGPASAYTDLQKERQAQLANVTNWEELFLTPYKLQSEQVSQQADYDISQAYANYKKTQLNLAMNQQLETGFKEKIASDLLSSYESSYDTTRLKQYNELLDIQQNYTEELEAQEKTLSERSEMFKRLEEFLYSYEGEGLSPAVTDSELLTMNRDAYKTITGDKGKKQNIYGLGYYTKIDNDTFELTPYGKAFFEERFEDKDFSRKLFEEDEELYNFYMSNMAEAQELIAGIKEGEKSGKEQVEELEKEKARKEHETSLADAKKRNSKVTNVGKIDGSTITILDKKYNISKIDANKAYEILDKMVRNGGLRDGDIFKYDGQEYVYKSSASLSARDNIFLIENEDYQAKRIEKRDSLITGNSVTNISKGFGTRTATINGQTYTIKEVGHQKTPAALLKLYDASKMKNGDSVVISDGDKRYVLTKKSGQYSVYEIQL